MPRICVCIRAASIPVIDFRRSIAVDVDVVRRVENGWKVEEDWRLVVEARKREGRGRVRVRRKRQWRRGRSDVVDIIATGEMWREGSFFVPRSYKF